MFLGLLPSGELILGLVVAIFACLYQTHSNVVCELETQGYIKARMGRFKRMEEKKKRDSLHIYHA